MRNDERKIKSCDETHIYESWTVIVPEDSSAQIHGRGYTSGEQYGEMRALTPHSIDQKQIDKQHRTWWIKNNRDRIGKIDVIITRRDLLGAFQPNPTESEFLVPQVNTCNENTAGIYLNNPTGRAELMITTPHDLPIKGDLKLWKQIGSRPPEPLETRAEEARVIDSHKIYWSLSQETVKEAESNDLTMWIGWKWERPIQPCPLSVTVTN